MDTHVGLGPFHFYWFLSLRMQIGQLSSYSLRTGGGNTLGVGPFYVYLLLFAFYLQSHPHQQPGSAALLLPLLLPLLLLLLQLL